MTCEACKRALPEGCLRFCWSCLRLQPAGVLTVPELHQLVERRRMALLGRGRLVSATWTTSDGEELVVHGRVWLTMRGDEAERVEIVDATTDAGVPRFEAAELCRRKDFEVDHDAVLDELVVAAIADRQNEAEPSSVDEAREGRR